jgi:hypothetical protein
MGHRTGQVQTQMKSLSERDGWAEQSEIFDDKTSSQPQRSFKLVFLTVVGITVLAGVAEIVMAAVWTNPTPDQQSTFEAAGFGWKAGIGAIFGLLGGKISA